LHGELNFVMLLKGFVMLLTGEAMTIWSCAWFSFKTPPPLHPSCNQAGSFAVTPIVIMCLAGAGSSEGV